MKIVFLGSGSMGSAMLHGIVKSGAAAPGDLIATAAHGSHFAELQALGIRTTTDNRAAAREADVLFLAVKPHLFEPVIAEIRDVLPETALVVSIAAGQTLAALQAQFGGGRRIVRVMPNTPAMVGAAMSAYCGNEFATDADLETVRQLLEAFGLAEKVPERLMDAVIGVSGSSPAYAYLFIEALADGAVLAGMPRKQAYTFAAQSVLGAAKMVLESGQHPGALKDAVCSPGGTTIAAVAKLEERGLRSAVIEAERACVEASRAMTK